MNGGCEPKNGSITKVKAPCCGLSKEKSPIKKYWNNQKLHTFSWGTISSHISLLCRQLVEPENPTNWTTCGVKTLSFDEVNIFLSDFLYWNDTAIENVCHAIAVNWHNMLPSVSIKSDNVKILPEVKLKITKSHEYLACKYWIVCIDLCHQLHTCCRVLWPN